MPTPRRDGRRPRVTVLRLGHRPGRDPRLTTHVALAARAFGADRMLLTPPDPALADRLSAVAQRWGGGFRVEGVERWSDAVRRFAGGVVHLTMYGEPLDRALPRLRRRPELLVVVGGAKVPAELYRRADYNVAVGAQPHSEVAALAVLLDRLGGLPDGCRFRGAERRIVPQRNGKRVLRTGRGRAP